MPKQKNIIQFSLPEDRLAQLEGIRVDEESISLCAKRLLLETLEMGSSGVIQGRDSLEIKLDKILEAIAAISDVPVKKNVPEPTELEQLKQQFKEIKERIVELEQTIGTLNLPPEQTIETQEIIEQESQNDSVEQKEVSDLAAAKLLGASSTTARNLRNGKVAIAKKWLRKMNDHGLEIKNERWFLSR